MNNDKKVLLFKINDTEISTVHDKMVAHDILELAEKKGAFPGKPEDYVLRGDKREYGWNDWVNLHEDNRFFTVRNQPTQVS